MMTSKFNDIKNPYKFVGTNKNKEYFEGWYYKFVSKDNKYVCAFIPGVSMTNANEGHCFIQFIDNSNNKPLYFNYPLNQFEYNQSPYYIKIGKSIFFKDKIIINLENDTHKIKGTVNFKERIDINRSFISPTIMGFFSYFKFMECQHRILSMQHKLYGTINHNNNCYNFTNGKGYIEKDMGSSFPKKWLWVHCNSFAKYNVSFTCAIATIPFVLFKFMGLICVLHVDGKEYRFATYNGAHVTDFRHINNKHYITLKKGHYKLFIVIYSKEALDLTAPVNGNMNRTSTENLNSHLTLKLCYKNKILYKGKGINTGFEFNE